MKKNNFLTVSFTFSVHVSAFLLVLITTCSIFELPEVLGNSEIQDDGFKMAAIFQSRRNYRAITSRCGPQRKGLWIIMWHVRIR